MLKRDDFASDPTATFERVNFRCHVSQVSRFTSKSFHAPRSAPADVYDQAQGHDGARCPFGRLLGQSVQQVVKSAHAKHTSLFKFSSGQASAFVDINSSLATPTFEHINFPPFERNNFRNHVRKFALFIFPSFHIAQQRITAQDEYNASSTVPGDVYD